MDNVPFTQRFVGAVLVAVVGGLIVHTVTEKPRFAFLRDLFNSHEAGTQQTAAPPPQSDSRPSDGAQDSGRKADEQAQRRTVVETRDIGTAMFSWVVDQVGAGAAGQSQVEGAVTIVDLKKFPLISHRELYKILVPTYLQSIPKTDGWGHPYEFHLNVANPLARQVITVRSPGRDGRYSATSYSVGPFAPEDFDEDIVWADGYFVQWPHVKEKQTK